MLRYRQQTLANHIQYRRFKNLSEPFDLAYKCRRKLLPIRECFGRVVPGSTSLMRTINDIHERIYRVYTPTGTRRRREHDCEGPRSYLELSCSLLSRPLRVRRSLCRLECRLFGPRDKERIAPHRLEKKTSGLDETRCAVRG